MTRHRAQIRAGSGKVVALRRDREHARAQRLVLLGGERVHRAEPGDPALEANDLALGALGRGRVELDGVVVSEVADGAGELRHRGLARDDLRARRPGARRPLARPRPRPRHARSRGRAPRTRAPGSERDHDVVLLLRLGELDGRARRLAATLEAMHDRGKCVALGDEPPGLGRSEPGPGCLERAPRGFAPLLDVRALRLCPRDEQLGLLGGEPGSSRRRCEPLGRAHLFRRQPSSSSAWRSLAAANRRSASVVRLDSRDRFASSDDDGRRWRAPTAPLPSLECLLGSGGKCRRCSLRRPCSSIRVNGDGERLIEVVEAIPRVGCGSNGRRLDPLGAFGSGSRIVLVAGELERVDCAAAAQPRRRDHRAVTEHRDARAQREGGLRRREVGSDPDAAQEMADRATRGGIGVDGGRQQPIRLGRRVDRRPRRGRRGSGARGVLPDRGIARLPRCRRRPRPRGAPRALPPPRRRARHPSPAGSPPGAELAAIPRPRPGRSHHRRRCPAAGRERWQVPPVRCGRARPLRPRHDLPR